MKATRSLLLSCLLALVLTTAAQTENKPLGSLIPGDETTTTPTTTTTTPTTTPTPSTTPTTTPTTTTPTTTSTTTSTSNTTPNTTPTTTNTSPTTTPTTQTTPPSQNTQTDPPQQSTVTRTAANGQTTVFVTSDDNPSPTSNSDSASTNSSDADSTKSKDSSGLGTGSIIGLSVAGGVALIGIIAFFVWKFTRKRFSDFDDNEAIKWPELNAHGNIGGADSHPLPVHNTGRAGFDTGSEVSLSRAPSNSGTNYSTPDLGADPYAVPPLPHLNPNQPYRDDPGAAGAYYDPYRGPIPNTFNETGHEWGHGGEAIPMTQMAPPPGMGAMAMGGRSSPAPSIARQMSPGPNTAYDMGRRSPGPNMMMGRASPGPHAAYDAYGPR